MANGGESVCAVVAMINPEGKALPLINRADCHSGLCGFCVFVPSKLGRATSPEDSPDLKKKKCLFCD